MKVIDIIKDNRINCYSVMLRMNAKEYLTLVEKAYENNGGIEGQRVPLKNKTGVRIRQTMVKDIKAGGLLPSLVIGCVTEGQVLKRFEEEREIDEKSIEDIIKSNSISIIDGMQRTTALKEIFDNDGDLVNELRVELWITDLSNSLIYRMLVLNTGQISWSLKKQLEVVFTHIKDEIQDKIKDISLIESNDNKRANEPGVYQVSHLVELYIAFTIRKEKIKLDEEITEKFAKIDFTELTSKFNHLDYYIEILEVLINMDKIFTQEIAGKRIFGDHNARLGFFIAASRSIFGRIGKELDKEVVENNYKTFMDKVNVFIERLKAMTPEEVEEFADVDTLKEITTSLNRKKDIIELYTNAFKVLIEDDFELQKLYSCWVAY